MIKKIIKIGVIALGILVVAGGLFFNSCQKEKKVSTSEQSIQHPTKKGGVTITMTWTKWGRKAKGCDGAGLCYFTITIKKLKSNIAPNSATLYSIEDYYDDDVIVNMYADILIDANYVFDKDGTSFYIDSDLSNYDDRGYKYVIPCGTYPFNPDLGELGGYTIPVIRVIEKPVVLPPTIAE
jgi:hypothetical protein